MTEFKLGFVHANGIRLHYVEAGRGPLVVLCHGWPESWYSWRHQLLALADAGYRAVAPDQRGYGQTERPDAITAYGIFDLVGDIVGLVNALGEKDAVIVGHDWGALVAQQCALLRPDMFRALALLSVPFLPRGTIRPAVAFQLATQKMNFYQEYFQEPGRVERELEEDVRKSIVGLLYGGSGDSPVRGMAGMFPKGMRFADGLRPPENLPSWLTEDDVAFFVSEFTRAGFRGGINWYRNIDRNWELTPFQDGAKITQPSLFVAGERDMVLVMFAEQLKVLAANMPRLKGSHILPGAGHWVQQERAAEVSALLCDFIAGL
jgi:pimeloyl-ACP methyl ester carboxylesterase